MKRAPDAGSNPAGPTILLYNWGRIRFYCFFDMCVIIFCLKHEFLELELRSTMSENTKGNSIILRMLSMDNYSHCCMLIMLNKFLSLGEVFLLCNEFRDKRVIRNKIYGDRGVLKSLTDFIRLCRSGHKIKEPRFFRDIIVCSRNICILSLLLALRKRNYGICHKDLLLLKDFLEELREKADKILVILVYDPKRWAINILTAIKKKLVNQVVTRILFLANNLSTLVINFLPPDRLEKLIPSIFNKFELPIMCIRKNTDLKNLIKVMLEIADVSATWREKSGSAHVDSYTAINVVNGVENNPKATDMLRTMSFLSIRIGNGKIEVYDKIYNVKIVLPEFMIPMLMNVPMGKLLGSEEKKVGARSAHS